MEKKTLLARLEKGGFLKKDGTYKCGVHMVLDALANGEKIHGHYSGRGRFCSYMDTDIRLAIAVSDALKLKTTFGNDAPRDGKIGDYIMLAKGEAKKIKGQF